MALFADTFFWIAVTDPNDSAHFAAVAITSEHADADLVTTDEVLTEYLAYFSNATEVLRREAGAIALGLLESPKVRVIAQSRKSFLDGLSLYMARPDKGYSLTDCVSMQTMRREGITQALTNDRHFEQEGLRALFR